MLKNHSRKGGVRAKLIIGVAVLLYILLALPVYASGNCASPYFKSIACADLNHSFDLNGYIWASVSKNAWTPTGQLDWNLPSSSLYDSNLVAYYKFNDKNSSGYILNSKTGNMDGLLTNGADTNAFGMFDSNAGFFDGTNDYVVVPDSDTLDFNTSSFTISAWVNTDFTSGTYVAIAGKRAQVTNTEAGYEFMIRRDTRKIYFYIGNGSAGVANESTASIDGSVGWKHVVMVVDRANNVGKIYVNGLQSGGNINIASVTNGIANANNLFIGANTTTPYYPMKGAIDELKFWNKALSSAEIVADYNSFLRAGFTADYNSIVKDNALSLRNWQTIKVNSDTNFYFGREMDSNETKFFDANLVALYHLNDKNSDGWLLNSVRGVRDANLNNGADVNTSGLWDTNAAFFDGVNDYVAIYPNPVSVSNYSVSLWMKPRSNATLYPLMSIANSPFAPGPAMLFQNNSGTFRVYGYVNLAPLQVDRWYHVVDVRGNGMEQVYIDGILVLDRAVSASNQNVFYIGSGYNGAFKGDIDEVALWDRTLSASEALDLYRKGVSRLDLNVYSCSDANCNTKTSIHTITNVRNNYPNSLSLSPSRYLGYDANFVEISPFIDYNAGTFFVNSYLSDVTVTSTAGNVSPTLDLNRLEGTSVDAVLPYYSYAQDGNMTLTFNVLDTDNDALNLKVYLASSTSQDSSGTQLLDANLSTAYCPTTDWNVTAVACSVDLNTLKGDGNYYLKAILNDGLSTPAYDFSTYFGIDNNAPTVSSTSTHSDWNRRVAQISLSCSDTQTGCSSTRYRVDSGTWTTYSSAVSLSGDGNHLFEFDSNDSKQNRSQTQGINVLVGFNGELRTYNDSNAPESFFAAGEKARLVYDLNFYYPVTITVKNSSGATVASATMSNVSNDANYGVADLNTLYYRLDTSGQSGWLDVNVGNQLFPQAIYVGPIWSSKYSAADGNTFTFSFDLNIAEPAKVQRWFYPIDTRVDFNYGAAVGSVRVLDYNGTRFFEVPSQLHDPTYSNGKVTSANLVFLASLAGGQMRRYYVSYSAVDKNKTYGNDLNARQLGYTFDVNTSIFHAVFDVNQGGVLRNLSSKLGTSFDLNSQSTLENAPYLIDDIGTKRISEVTSPSYSFTAGELYSKLQASSQMNSANYDINYKFYSKSRYIIVDLNFVSRGSFYWQQYLETNPKLDVNKLSNYAVLAASSLSSGSLSHSGSTSSLNDVNAVLIYNPQTLDAFGTALVSAASNLSPSNTVYLRDLSSYTGWERRTIEDTPVSVGKYVYTQKAFLVPSTLRGFYDANQLFVSIKNPLTVSIGSTTTNDSGAAPTLVDINHIPYSGISDQTDVNCYSSWQDDTIINSITMHATGPNVDINSTSSVLASSGSLSYLLTSSMLHGGDINCQFTATDVAGNSASMSTSFTVANTNAPSIYGLANTPDGNANIDPDQNVVVDANITSYSAISSVTLYTRLYDSNSQTWSDWNTSAMGRDQNYSDVNFRYRGWFVATQGTWQYFVRVIDANSLDRNSSTIAINSFLDYTWTVTPADLGTKSGQLGTTISVGTITLTGTGDRNVSFRLSSNWENKYEIWFDGAEETPSGYLFELGTGLSKAIAVTLKTKTVGRSDSLSLTLTPTTTGEPDSNSVSATIVSLSTEAFLFLEWTDTNSSITQGDSNVSYAIKVTNTGTPAATDLNFDWNYPSGWAINTGSASSTLSTLASASSTTRFISFDVPTTATVGDQNILFTAACCSDTNKTQYESTLTTVVAKPSSGSGGDSGNSGGAGGGGGGGGSSGGALPFGSEEEKNLFFKTTQFFELVRGQDSKFPITVTNSLDGNMLDINLSVSGLVSKYLQLRDTHINSLDANTEFDTFIEITSPKYFDPAEYEITFSIEGMFQQGYHAPRKFKETRAITLLIHDTNKETAEYYLSQMQSFYADLNKRGLRTGSLPGQLNDSGPLLDAHKYDDIASFYEKAKSMHDNAVESTAQIGKLSSDIASSANLGIDTPSTKRILRLAQLASQRGEYALALDRIKEAQLTYGLETKGEFNIWFFIAAHIYEIIAAAAALAIILYFVYLWIKLQLVNRKLEELNKENKLLLDLIKDLQQKCFVQNKISLGEYYDALNQFEGRIAQISEGLIEMESKKLSIFNFSGKVARLNKEREHLVSLVKQTQKEYFTLNLIETKIYKTKMDSMTGRLSEVEEQIVLSDLLKTSRTTRGIMRHLWQIYYRVVPS